MVLLEVRKLIDRDETKHDQGPWPRKTMVSLWFKHDTSLMLMIEILKKMREKMAKTNYSVSGELVRTNLEIRPEKKTLRRSQAMFFKAFKDALGDKSQIECSRFLSLLNWERRASGSWQSNINARANVTRMKFGKSIQRW